MTDDPKQESVKDVLQMILQYAEGPSDFMGDQAYHPDADEMLVGLVERIEAALASRDAAILEVAGEIWNDKHARGPGPNCIYDEELEEWAARLKAIAEGKEARYRTKPRPAFTLGKEADRG
jgi:hypothetical protein